MSSFGVPRRSWAFATLLTLTSLAPRPASAEERAPVLAEREAHAAAGRQRAVAGVVGGLGLAALGVASVAGVLAISHRSDASRACPVETYHFRCPTEDGAADWNAAHRAGSIATVSLVTAGILFGGATLLWFTVPKTSTTVGAAGTSVVVTGHF